LCKFATGFPYGITIHHLPTSKIQSMQSSPTNPTAFADAAEMWNQRFSDESYLFGTEPNVWLREHASRWKAGHRVLCVADGEGRNSVWLAGQGLDVDAFDISEVGVAKAKRLAAERKVSIRLTVSDCDTYAWPQNTYDGVALIFLQFADPDMRARLFANIQQCLKPGGVLVLQGYTPKQLEYKTGGPPTVSHLYTESMMREAFADWEIVELSEYEAELREGDRHVGRSALIGMVARRY